MRLWRRQTLKLAASSLLAWPRLAEAEEGSSNERARWIAGVAPVAGTPSGAEWAAYARDEAERWTRQAPRINAMQEWSARELSPLLPAGRAVFYPFAGPDALHAIALFGAAPHLLLVGLEPVGMLPDPARVRAGYFERLSAALADVHRLTFFRTHAMASDFQRDGVVGALVGMVVRMGGTVSSVQTASASARIDWAGEGGVTRRLEYLSADLANAGWRGNSPLAAMVRALAPCVTFVKAASYLLAEPRFSAVRQAILEGSAAVIQDDTGVPFRFFDAGWGLRFFGRYDAPGSPFEDRLQPDLRDAYDKRAPGPLPFGVGYHVDAKRSNLLVAVKGT